MKKAEQMTINAKVVEALNAYEKATEGLKPYWEERLLSCQATVYGMGDYIALVSYSTLVAVYDCNKGVVFDFLRYVYGYTATSAKQISKFKREYAPNADMLTYREI